MRGHIRPLMLAAVLVVPLAGILPSGIHAADPAHVRIDAVAALARVPPDAERISTALIIDLAPGWKTYWRSPGPFGMPLSVTPAASSNVTLTDIMWPAPTRFAHPRTPALSTVGYAGRTVIPMELHLDRTAGEIRFDADVSLGICRDVCIPHDAQISLHLPRGNALETPHAAIIEAALNTLPHQNNAPDAPARIAWAAWATNENDILIGICTNSGKTDDMAVFIAALDGASFATPPEIQRASGETVIYRARIDPDFLTGTEPARPAVGTLLDITFKEPRGAVAALLPLRGQPPESEHCPPR